METKLFNLLLSAAALFVLTGCAATKSTITEYDASGNILKKTETSESVISSVTKSTRNKSVIIWEDGWAGYISVSSGTLDDPTPHGSTIRPRTAESLPARSTRELSAFCRTRADFPESQRSFRRRSRISPSALTEQVQKQKPKMICSNQSGDSKRSIPSGIASPGEQDSETGTRKNQCL